MSFFLNSLPFARVLKAWCEKIRHIKLNRKEKMLLKAVYPTLSEFLVNGSYIVFNNKLIKICKRKAMFSVDNSKKAAFTYSNGTIIFGEWTDKVIILFSDAVLSFYTIERISWIKHIEEYLPHLNLPVSELLAISADDRYTLFKRVRGRKLTKNDDLIFILNDILDRNVKSKKTTIIPNDDRYKKIKRMAASTSVLSYIQHGDVANCNIFVDGSDYCLIDMDLINYYPAMYDFFSLVTYGDNGHYLLPLVFNDFFSMKIGKLFDTDDLSRIRYYSDQYLALFFAFRPNRMKPLLSELNMILPDDYTEMRKALSEYRSDFDNL